MDAVDRFEVLFQTIELSFHLVKAFDVYLEAHRIRYKYPAPAYTSWYSSLGPPSEGREDREKFQSWISRGPPHGNREWQHHDLVAALLDLLGCRHVLDEIALPSADRAKRIRATRTKPSAEVRDDREHGRSRSISATREIRAILENLARPPNLIAIQQDIGIDENTNCP